MSASEYPGGSGEVCALEGYVQGSAEGVTDGCITKEVPYGPPSVCCALQQTSG